MGATADREAGAAGPWLVCGWFGDLSPAVPPAMMLSRMARDVLGGTAAALTATHPRAGLLLSRSVPGRALVQDGSLVAAVFGHLRWSDSTLSDLAVDRGPAAALLEAYRRQGPDLLARARGPFGLIVLDPDGDRALIAIDAMGIQPMAYAPLPDRGVIFATSATAIARHPAAGAAISLQGVFNYLFFYRVPAPGSIFSGQRKLLPAHALHVRGTAADARAHWTPPFRVDGSASADDLRAPLFQCLRAGIGRALAGCDPERTGTFLSGGLDSSVVTALAQEAIGRPVKAFTIGFDCDGYDETGYAEHVARHFGVDHRLYRVTPEDVFHSVATIAAAYDEPFGNASAVPVHACARFARSQGMDTLLAGDGGDELFAGNQVYLWMKIFELYGLIPAPLRRWLIEPVVRAFPGGEATLVGRKAKGYVAKASVPMPERMFAHELDLLGRAAEIVAPEFLAAVTADEPVRVLREVYHRPPVAAFEQRMHHLEWQVVLADNDLRKVTRMCALAGIDVRFPMLDEDVVDFSAAVPPRLFLKGLKLRAFFKRAMTGYLPEKTLEKRKQGFGLPVGPWLSPGTPLRELAYDSLASLKGRHYVRAAFIDRVIGEHRAHDHPLFAGPIWDLMMLEQWFRTHDEVLSGAAGAGARSVGSG